MNTPTNPITATIEGEHERSATVTASSALELAGVLLHLAPMLGDISEINAPGDVWEHMARTLIDQHGMDWDHDHARLELPPEHCLHGVMECLEDTKAFHDEAYDVSIEAFGAAQDRADQARDYRHWVR